MTDTHRETEQAINPNEPASPLGMGTPIRDVPIDALAKLMEHLGQPSYRANQLRTWLHVRGVGSYDEMTDLPKDLRSQLADLHPIAPTKIVNKQISRDGTRKYVIELSDGALVETVGMPSADHDEDGKPKRLSVCFSSQAGCALGCAFCATGQAGFQRNLSANEMIQQILVVQNDFDARVSHVVAMGQGEPFLNTTELLKALEFMNDKKGLGIGARHITVSTCGITKGIQRFAAVPQQYTLAISLHSARQNVRNDLMPGCTNRPLDQLKDALIEYQIESGRRFSFEYLLIKDINDAERDLDALKGYCRNLLCHVNLIPLNQIDGSTFMPPSNETLDHWKEELERSGIETTIRNSRGSDIDGACGQLKNKLGRR